MKTNEIINSDVIDALKGLPDNSIDCCVTSPPYFGLRDYGVEGQIGLEKTPEEYIAKLTEVFRHVRRILKPEGTLWLNIGDSYNGYKGNSKRKYCGSDYAGFRNQPTRPANFGLECKGLKEKDLIGIPWLLAFALRSEGWYLRLAQTLRNARKRKGQMHQIARIHLPAEQKQTVLFRLPFHSGAGLHVRRYRPRPQNNQAEQHARSYSHERIAPEQLYDEKQTIRLDDLCQAVQRCALRRLPRTTCRTLHQSRLPRRRNRT